MFLNWRVVAAGSMAAAALSPGRAVGGEAAPHVRVLWVDTRLVERFVGEVGRTEARDVLESLGVQIAWRVGRPATESREDEVRVVPLARHLGDVGRRRILAATSRRAGPRTVWVDWPGIVWVSGLENDAVPAAPAAARRRVGLVLGRVLAHELIHALLPELPHADEGLMSDVFRDPGTDAPSLDSRSRAALLSLGPHPLGEAASAVEAPTEWRGP